jgi:hypothetical protein
MNIGRKEFLKKFWPWISNLATFWAQLWGENWEDPLFLGERSSVTFKCHFQSNGRLPLSLHTLACWWNAGSKKCQAHIFWNILVGFWPPAIRHIGRFFWVWGTACGAYQYRCGAYRYRLWYWWSQNQLAVTSRRNTTLLWWFFMLSSRWHNIWSALLPPRSHCQLVLGLVPNTISGSTRSGIRDFKSPNMSNHTRSKTNQNVSKYVYFAFFFYLCMVFQIWPRKRWVWQLSLVPSDHNK